MQTYAKRTVVLVIIFIMVIGVLSANGTPEVVEPKGLYDFWSIDMTGEDVTQEIFAPYKLTMINVWATYCPPCIHEMPILAELKQTYEEQGVNIIGIINDLNFSSQEAFSRSLATAHQIIQQTGAHYTHIIPTEQLYNLRLKDVQVVPETFFVDSNGTIVGETIYGARDKAGWISILETTLQLVDR